MTQFSGKAEIKNGSHMWSVFFVLNVLPGSFGPDNTCPDFLSCFRQYVNDSYGSGKCRAEYMLS